MPGECFVEMLALITRTKIEYRDVAEFLGKRAANWLATEFLPSRQPEFEELHKSVRDALAAGSQASRLLNIPQFANDSAPCGSPRPDSASSRWSVTLRSRERF